MSVLIFFILLLIVCYTNGCACHPRIPSKNSEKNVSTSEKNDSTSNGRNPGVRLLKSYGIYTFLTGFFLPVHK
jgi:hypothetical protein